MLTPDPSAARWRKSSYSTNQADCVEVAFPGRAVAVRDSKRPAAGTLGFATATWSTFLSTVRAR